MTDRNTAHLQIFVGVFGMGVCLPYLTGVFGHVEMEVALWAFVVLAVSAGLVASAARIGPLRWWCRVLLDGAAFVLLALASWPVVLVVLTEDWGPILVPVCVMLAVGWLIAVGRPWIGVRVEHGLLVAEALLLLAAQIPAIWAWFHYGMLSDHPGRIPIRPQAGFALPHIVFALLLFAWGARKAVEALRELERIG